MGQAPTIKTNTTSVRGGAWVNVTWAGVPEAERLGCWIGVFAPADAVNTTVIPAIGGTGTAPWIATAPIKFLNCSNGHGAFLETGSAWYPFILTNLREDVVFILFVNGLIRPVASSRTVTVNMTDKEAPLHPHLALTGDPTEMRVVWNARSIHINPTVQWGTQKGGPYPYTAAADINTYSADDLCGAPASTQGWRNPGYFYTAEMTDLKPLMRYYYIVGAKEYGYTSEMSFRAIAAPNPHMETNVVILGDVGETEVDGTNYHWPEVDAIHTIENAETHLPEADATLHVGDISYATGYEAEWTLFMHQIASLSGSAPYMVGYGNHERDWPDSESYYPSHDSGGECGVPTEMRFPMPTPTHTQATGYYGISIQNIHFTVMNTELTFGPGTQQYAFLDADLASVNRSETPWLVFAGHRPMYFVNRTDPKLAVLEPLLKKHKVDLVLWAHVHNAQVTCPVYAAKCVNVTSPATYAAPVHTVIGNGGQALTQFTTPRAEWSVYQRAEWGHEYITAHNATHLQMRFYSNKDNNALHYSFFITRQFPRE